MQGAPGWRGAIRIARSDIGRKLGVPLVNGLGIARAVGAVFVETRAGFVQFLHLLRAGLASSRLRLEGRVNGTGMAKERSPGAGATQEFFRFDAGFAQRRLKIMLHHSSGRLPCLARHTEHGALSRPGITDDNAKIAPVRDMHQRIDLLAGKDQPALFGTRKRGLPVPVADLVQFLLGH
ncbi:hypothetical protein GCM10011499_08090 [Pelagibacterium lentulum]|uniref:Uncharacterized protein n=1 Tax=Pelagibacterium lentulum TaxID=2029865 RepID=A0A916VVK6_9HYPH|nr:hypothetical protein GCM10011499_08090 [Pelagibacterium lentulum]